MLKKNHVAQSSNIVFGPSFWTGVWHQVPSPGMDLCVWVLRFGLDVCTPSPGMYFCVWFLCLGLDVCTESLLLGGCSCLSPVSWGLNIWLIRVPSGPPR